MGDAIDAVFVYGTLKRGQCRETAWPAEPASVLDGWILAHLYGRIDYPAVTRGEDRVAGEYWSFDLEAMPRVLTVLDRIEGTFGNQPDDLYHRLVVPVMNADGKTLGNAFAYFYNGDPEADGFHRVMPTGGVALWQAK